jgi:ketosteroid isomerase-like protein
MISVATPAQEALAIPQWAQTFLQNWYVAYNGSDVAGVSRLFTADASLGPHKGRAAITGDLKKTFAAASYRCTGHFEALRELGELAVAWGVETCVETPKGSVSSNTTKERWLIVFERQPDGRWLISRETWEDLPP